MPIFEFKCRKCQNKFEELIYSTNSSFKDLSCPACGSKDMEKLISTFNSKGISTGSSCISCSSDSCSTCAH